MGLNFKVVFENIICIHIQIYIYITIFIHRLYIGIYLGSTPPRIPVANEGLVWDSLLKM